jgi:hypothetical protein
MNAVWYHRNPHLQMELARLADKFTHSIASSGHQFPQTFRAFVGSIDPARAICAGRLILLRPISDESLGWANKDSLVNIICKYSLKHIEDCSSFLGHWETKLLQISQGLNLPISASGDGPSILARWGDSSFSPNCPFSGIISCLSHIYSDNLHEHGIVELTTSSRGHVANDQTSVICFWTDSRRIFGPVGLLQSSSGMVFLYEHLNSGVWLKWG